MCARHFSHLKNTRTFLLYYSPACISLIILPCASYIHPLIRPDSTTRSVRYIATTVSAIVVPHHP